jgi:cell wall assembly regulator SMI1
VSNIIATLEEIAAQALKIGMDMKSSTNPGATSMQIKGVLDRLPFRLPEGVIDFYRWRNGVQQARLCDALFPNYVFPPLEACVEETLSFIALSDSPEVVWRRSWFSFCTDLCGDGFGVDSKSGEPFGVIWAMKFGEAFPGFHSVHTMFESILECYKSGAYFLNKNGLLEERRELSDSIYRALNHGLSPLRLGSKEKLMNDMKQAKQKYEDEGRSDLIENLRELAKKSGFDLD